jgi:histidinol-phosphatase (PHP family)
LARIPHDYHLHSDLSVDCRAPMAAQAQAAVALGLREICVTEHCDYVPQDEGCGYYRPEAYFAELARCREQFDGRLMLRAGVEIGEPHRYPEEAAALVGGYPYDFVIGSLHWVDGQIVLEHNYFAGKSAAEAYEAYFTELLAMVRHGGFDVIGHLDVPKRAGFDVHGPFRSRDFAEPMRAVLRAAAEAGIGIEINSGTARRPIGELTPDIDVLRWYRELGGEIITVGSDAHRPEHLAYRFDDAAAMLSAAGFTAITGFAGRAPFFVDLK